MHICGKTAQKSAQLTVKDEIYEILAEQLRADEILVSIDECDRLMNFCKRDQRVAARATSVVVLRLRLHLSGPMLTFTDECCVVPPT